MKRLFILIVLVLSTFFSNAQSPEFFVNAKTSYGKTSGDCQNGFGTCVWGTGVYTITYSGDFLNGKPNGKGKYYRMIEKLPLAYKYESYEGNWKDGFFDGFGIYKKEKLYKKKKDENFNESITYEGNWKNGFKEGAGKYLEKDGSGFPEYRKYDGNWKNDKYEGYGSYSSKSKNETEESYAGYWESGSYNGQGVYKKEGVREGLWKYGSQINGKIFDYNGVLICEGEKEIAIYNKKRGDELNANYERSKELVEENRLAQAKVEQSKIDKTSSNTNVVKDAQSERTAKCMCCLGTGQKEIKGMYLGTKTISVTPVNGLGISHNEIVSEYGPSTFVPCSCCH